MPVQFLGMGAFATLDQISDGRLTVHFITGGNVEFGEQVIPIVREEVARRDRERGVLAAAS